MKRELIAIHEAGHMVIALYADLLPLKVTILPTSESLGHVLMRSYSRRFEDACYCLSPYMADRLDKIIQTTLAGGLAEKKFCGRWNHAGCAFDRKSAAELGCFRYTWDSKSFEHYMKLMHSVTEDSINCRWREIQAVKDALLDHETLTRKQVRAVLGEISRGG